ncbi:membrane protein [Fulvitalea axinellae]|uniref:Membrane protein n=2 Tax=Fulvitalea axinellae TaxID=1182444 RepID=A0AAU9CXE8_9BACT|nr:membrane protein [Fulvitalea axinellae]
MVIAGLLVLVGAFFTMQYLAGLKKPPKKKTPVERQRSVPTLLVHPQTVRTSVPVLGKIRAIQRAEIYAEVNGRMLQTAKPFREGIRYSKGELMVSIDRREAENNLKARKSQLATLILQMLPDLKLDYPDSYKRWRDYIRDFDVNKPLPPLPDAKTDKEKYFVFAKNIKTTYFEIRSLEIQLQKYAIRAPFNGELIESNIEPGTLVRTGQKLGELIGTDNFELTVSLRLYEAEQLKKGDKAVLKSESGHMSWTGTVVRVNSSINEATQSVEVYISLRGAGLKEGMFLTGRAEAQSVPKAVKIPRKALRNNEVFLLEKGKATPHAVHIAQIDGDSAVIQGLPSGALLVLDNTGLRKGSEITALETGKEQDKKGKR